MQRLARSLDLSGCAAPSGAIVYEARIAFLTCIVNRALPSSVDSSELESRTLSRRHDLFLINVDQELPAQLSPSSNELLTANSIVTTGSLPFC